VSRYAEEGFHEKREPVFDIHPKKNDSGSKYLFGVGKTIT
jgi:hypothetical protein